MSKKNLNHHDLPHFEKCIAGDKGHRKASQAVGDYDGSRGDEQSSSHGNYTMNTVLDLVSFVEWGRSLVTGAHGRGRATLLSF